MEQEQSTDITYPDPWSGLDRKGYNRVWKIYGGTIALIPLELILMGIGIYRGLNDMGHTMLFVAVAVSIALMVFRLLFEEKVSNHVNKTAWSTNEDLWKSVESNLIMKYGEGKVVPFHGEPKKISPPDGSPDLMTRLIMGDVKEKVVWTTPDGDHHQKMLTVEKDTFEPLLSDIPEKGQGKR